MTALATEIDIALELADQRIVGVRIAPRKLPQIGALVAGRPAAEMLKLVPRLFTLCSAAHGIAAQTAVDAARGIDVAPELHRQRAIAALSERLVEQLRGVVTSLRLLEQEPVAAAMREVIRASALLAAGSDAGIAGMQRAIDRIECGLDQIGVRGLRPANGAASFSRSAGAYLTAGDDLRVIARLAREGRRYADTPDLDGAAPETGAWARACAEAEVKGHPGGQPETAAARLQARLDEIVRMPQLLRRLAIENADACAADDSIIGYGLGMGGGAAAVETARGRLYYHVELDDDDRVRGFQCLAPTEWNFHRSGALAQMLRGAALAPDRGGREAVEQLIAAFDPCVGYRLTIREHADA
jgi:coenzyme F420-reducing hydrogenase alpha subunit